MIAVGALISMALASSPVALKLDDSPAPKVSFSVVHKLHKIEGVSQKLEGAGRVLDDGTIQAMVRATIASFDSGNSNRDAHMKEAVDSAKFPDVVVKAVLTAATPKTFPATVEVPAQLEVTLHGVAQKLSTPVKLEYQSAEKIRVRGSFPVSWESFKIERPQLMFVPIDDQGEITFDLSWSRH